MHIYISADGVPAKGTAARQLNSLTSAAPFLPVFAKISTPPMNIRLYIYIYAYVYIYISRPGSSYGNYSETVEISHTGSLLPPPLT